MTKRKTYTSPAVKNRWNREHYDRAVINLPSGGRAELQSIAAAKGMSVSAYIRHLIIADNAEMPESTHILRGGGVLDSWERSVSAAHAAKILDALGL
jgi:hypothetical protein